jgi:hypothetical protein
MTKPNIQIDSLVREMTDEEYTAYLADLAEQEVLEIERAEKAALRQSALAKLAALGLTEEEVASILGFTNDPLQNS